MGCPFWTRSSTKTSTKGWRPRSLKARLQKIATTITRASGKPWIWVVETRWALWSPSPSSSSRLESITLKAACSPPSTSSETLTPNNKSWDRRSSLRCGMRERCSSFLNNNKTITCNHRDQKNLTNSIRSNPRKRFTNLSALRIFPNLEPSIRVPPSRLPTGYRISSQIPWIVLNSLILTSNSK